MPFLQLSFESPPDPERLESACFAAGALSVTLTDAADAPIFEPPLDTTPLWPQVRLDALFDHQADRHRIVSEIAASVGGVPPVHSFVEVADKAWEREWLVDFKPMRFGKRLWICPHEQNVAAQDAIVVRLDPGLAFGTGTHQTTALCLEWLDGARLSGKTVIDYGCGSGILAIAAVKLGAERAIAVDHDPQALLATRENAERNGVARKIETLPAPANLPEADVLLANILALPLIELATHIRDCVARGGNLVLSGILADQADAVAAAYTPWFSVSAPKRRDDWICLHGVRR